MKRQTHKFKKYALKVQWSNAEVPTHKRWYFTFQDGTPYGTTFRTRCAAILHITNAFGCSNKLAKEKYGDQIKEFAMQATESFQTLEKLVKYQDKNRKSK